MKFNLIKATLVSVLISIFFLGCEKSGDNNMKSNIDLDAKVKFKGDNWTPDWAKKVVWYQIFPERFRNGDPGNDPKVENIKGSWPHDNESPWEVHPWTSDWYKLQEYEQKNGKNIWFNLQRRRYGGDIQGIIDKLDYLQNLGITALYLNPVFESPSLHKYDGATYHHIDPNFGPDPKGDREIIKNEIPDDPSTWVWTSADKLFLKLVEEVHKRGMKIIIDGVFNHMGLNSWVFKDVKENQQKSKYKNWLKIETWDDSLLGTEFKYTGWYGVRELPELNQDANGIVGEPKKYIFDITKRWMDPNGDLSLKNGIDGWRLDVAFMVKHKFWKDWRKQVKSINPNAYITAEIIDSIKVNKPYLEGDEFDAVMNYNFAFTCSEYFISDKTRISTSEFNKLLKDLREAFPSCVNYVMQNLFDSHDTNRLLSHIVNKDLFPYREWAQYYEKSRGSNPNYSTRKPDDNDIAVQKLMAIFQMTYLGAPMIYYGDEVGMWGANDPCCRKPMVWSDMKYDPETYNPDQTVNTFPDTVDQNAQLLQFYKKIISIRNENIALQVGDFKTLQIENEKQIFVFERNYEDNKVIVIINNSNDPQDIKIHIIDDTGFYDVLNNENIVLEQDPEAKFSIPAKWGRILVKMG